MTQQIGFTIGIPIMSAVAATRYGLLTDGVASVEGVLEGTTFGMLVDGLIVFATALLILFFLRRRRCAALLRRTSDGEAPRRPLTPSRESCSSPRLSGSPPTP